MAKSFVNTNIMKTKPDLDILLYSMESKNDSACNYPQAGIT